MNRERTDVAAETRLRTEFGHQLTKMLGGHDYAVCFEQYTNEQGVSVRRVVIYGPEECDPQVPVPEPRTVVGDARWLVWSNDAGTWWGPAGNRYDRRLDHAGRYTEAEARRACAMRSWSHPRRPPEVMVLSPEADPIPAGIPVEQEMARRVAAATATGVAERATGTRLADVEEMA